MSRDLTTPARYLKGVGLKRAQIFKKLGIFTAEDLLYYFPKRYVDRTNLSPIAKLTPGSVCAIKAKVITSSQRTSWARRGFNITTVVFGDNTGRVSCVWFNQPYLKNYFKAGAEVILYGKIDLYLGLLQMSSPEFEIIKDGDEDNSLSLGRLVPVYGLSQGITQRYFRRLIKSALDEFMPAVFDILPYDIRKRHGLINIAQALIQIHFPQSQSTQEDAYRRLSFEEFFLYQVPILMRKLKRAQKKGISHRIGGDIFNSFFNSLPFTLTNAQNRVLEEIKQDMAGDSPMQRLLQGEVGAGKTVVAILAAAVALDGGYQAAFMAPTEILAKQHYINIKKSLPARQNEVGLAGRQEMQKNKNINIALLTSGLKKKDKGKIYQKIKEGKIGLVVGTHALLEENVDFRNLGLVIIDEQHKFGVGQRALLPRKGDNPDCLIMTATPIPRTLSLTLYGDLDISTIDELPVGRVPIKTLVYGVSQRKQPYALVREELRKGRQAYVVCPNIEEPGLSGFRSAEEVYGGLKDEFKEFRVGIIHGRLKQEEQDKIMSEFKQGALGVLVATTVVEVGIDIPNVSVMVIEEAQAFGLAQLHQLRGRIGRGGYPSFCLLIADPQSPQAHSRIEAIASLSDGFKIAEEDLKIRGPGEFFGRRQSGLSELKIANPLNQMQLLKAAREEANKLLRADYDLSKRPNLGIRRLLKARFPEYQELMMAG